MKGIDICYNQGDIDFQKVKQAGYEFIIPRDGWGTEKIDPKLITYVQGAQQSGISVPGVYHFIYAINQQEALQNASRAIENVKKAGLPQTTIIWCDLEGHTVQNAKTRGVTLTAKMQREFAEVFCNYILAQGYCTGIYLNQDYLINIYGKDIADHYDIWFADPSEAYDYPCLYKQDGWYDKINGISGNVDTDVWVGTYTAGTAKKDGVEWEPADKEGINSGMIKSKDYVNCALKLLDRPKAYKNKYPWNCGLLDANGVTWGDCWNINPKTTVWSLAVGQPICDNEIVGESHVAEVVSKGITATGLQDVTGDYILNNYCDETTFRSMIEAKMAPCMLLITGSHMGAFIGDFERDGKTYNVSEFSPNDALGDTMRSYVDEYGRRLTHKGGTVIGTWNRCGYLTKFLDYSDWETTPSEDQTPDETPTADKSIDALALEIYAGKWGNNPGRKASIVAQYGETMYREAQDKVNSIVKAMAWYKTEIQLAGEILEHKWGNNPNRQTDITLKYGANAYRIAQNFVNSSCNGDYTLDDLNTAYDVANDILNSVYGNGEDRRNKIVEKYGETIQGLAQRIVNEVLK